MADKDRKSQRPAWQKPQSDYRTGLRVRNSLTETLEEFIPSEGKLVRWYICGPTVYDSSHLGHARSYLTFDIIRRIMEDYFGYNLFVCMNITDIDDKIILRARRNYLYAEYVKAHPTVTEEVFNDMKEAIDKHIAGLKEKKQNLEDDLANGRGNAVELKAELGLVNEKIQKSGDLYNRVSGVTIGANAAEWLELVKDQIAELEDSRKGATIDQEFMKKLAAEHSRKYEQEFMEDMKLLNIRTPDVLTRVSEYIPEIIEMTERIMENGYAYESEGSVYFDTAAFDRKNGHFYAKLKPNSVGDLKQLAEGEGALSTTGKKKNKVDFALWKKSKPGEPAWQSKWSMGRPGWHIECSAMAGKILGSNLDIHAGGEDLKFPHHDNELAQSEAYFNNHQWVNYFLHAGHLRIDGLKMSKSLKNFITIRDALKAGTPRQLRMLFLLQNWDSEMNYNRKDTMLEVQQKERTLTEFFQKVDAALNERKQDLSRSERWNEKDVALNNALLQAEKDVHAALQDNFNTPQAMRILMQLVTEANTYIAGNTARKALLLKKIAVFITKILRVFGVIEGSQEYGFPKESQQADAASINDVVDPYVRAIVKFRSDVRQAAKDKAPYNVFLQLTDSVRDDVMPELGVKVRDDDPSFPYIYVDKATLLKEKEERQRIEAEKARNKRQKELDGLLRKLKEAQDGMLDPFAKIKADHDIELTKEVTRPEDVPDKTISGADVSKSKKKNIVKEFAAQKKKHEAYLQQVNANPNYIQSLQEQIAALQASMQ